jgi:class 3 adenylate cyclase
MARLSARERASLPNSAFAYIDSHGRRRLPINDAAHVRAALARFEQVAFETDAARDAARERVLRAAKRFGIIPLGFMASQLRAERAQAGRGVDAATLPSGVVTFLLTDIEGSTALLERLGDGYTAVLSGVRRLIRDAVRRAGGREVDARADEFFAVFERPEAAIAAGVTFQRRVGNRRWPDGLEVRVRAGIHSGEITLTEHGYVGMAVHTAARVCALGHGGQILVSGATRDALASGPDGVGLRELGRYRLRGLPEPTTVLQVEADGLPAEFPPPRTAG